MTANGLAVIEKAFSEVVHKMQFDVVAFNGEADHIYYLIAYSPKLSISKMVNSLKGVSSRRYGQAKLLEPKGKGRCGVLATSLFRLAVRRLKCSFLPVKIADRVG